MKKTFNYLAITSCFVLGTSLVYADSDSNSRDVENRMFKAMDVNSDGKVSRDEFMNYDFKAAEKYGCQGMNDDARSSDGSSREWSDTSRERSTSSRTNSPSKKEKYAGTGVSGLAAGGADSTDGAAMDTNSDGRVTRDEYNNYGKTKFQQMDSNSDGEISSDEMTDGSTDGSAMDANSDGRVTQDEYNNYGRTKFQQMDSNKDGEINSDEMKAGSNDVNRRVRSH